MKAKDDDSDDADACDDPEIFKLMIEYMYHFDYLRGIDFGPAENKKRAETGRTWTSALCDAAFSPPEVQTWLVEHAKVFAMAVKYRVDGLYDLAAANFKAAATSHWDHVDFMTAISIVHSSTGEEITQLRTIVADTLYDHFDVLQTKVQIEKLVRSTAELSHALMMRGREKNQNFHSDPLASCMYGHSSSSSSRCWRLCGSCRRGYYLCAVCFSTTDCRTACPHLRCGAWTSTRRQ
jgi:hypothetical protein